MDIALVRVVPEWWTLRMERTARARLARVAHEAPGPGHIMAELRLGTFAGQVAQAVLEYRPDLIVVAAHPRSWIDRLLKHDPLARLPGTADVFVVRVGSAST